MTLNFELQNRLRFKFKDESLVDVPGVKFNKLWNVPKNCINLLSGEQKVKAQAELAAAKDAAGLILAQKRTQLEMTNTLRPFTLYPWQDNAVLQNYFKRSVYLFHAGGAGKTLTAFYLNALDDTPLVYVTLSYLMPNVVREWQLRMNRPIYRIEGREPDEDFIKEAVQARALILCNYNLLPYWTDVLVRNCAGASVVYDEAHVINNPKRTSRSVDADTELIRYEPITTTSGTYGVNYCQTLLAEQASRIMALSATPASIRSDWWHMLDTMEPLCWGSFWKYAARYCDMQPNMITDKQGNTTQRGYTHKGATNSTEFQARIATLISRVRKEEVNAVLPPLRIEVIPLGPKDVVGASKILLKAVKDVGRVNPRALMWAELDLICSKKSSWLLEDMTETFRQGKEKLCLFLYMRRTVKWYVDLFESELKLLSKAAGKPVGIDWVTSEVDSDARFSLLDNYLSNDTGPRILIATGDSLGTGSNMQNVDVAYFGSVPYEYQKIGQWIPRFHRPGGIKTVQIKIPYVQGSKEETIHEKLLSKLDTFTEDDMDQQVTALRSALESFDEEAALASILGKY
jgi:hypothetical protein